MSLVRVPTWVWLCGLWACGEDPGSSDGPATDRRSPEDTGAAVHTGAGGGPDTDRGGHTGPAGDTDPTGETGAPPLAGLGAPAEVLGLPNVDQPVNWVSLDPADDELVPLVIDPGELPGEELALSLEVGAAVRVWREGQVLLDADQRSVALPWSPEPLVLAVEFGSFGVEDALVVERRSGGAAEESARTALRSGPMLLQHHLQASELVVMVETRGNAAMRDVFARELGPLFELVPGARYERDVWIQDELEFAWATTPGDRMTVVIDSIRDRGLDDFPEDRFQGDDALVHTWGNQQANSFDSFGNLEATPPLGAFPGGQIYYGGDAGLGPNDTDLFAFLEAQAEQDPIRVDSTWLCVGHVDEFSSFVPDTTAPRGFRFVYTDTRLAWQILETVPGSTRLPQWSGRTSHGYSTVGELLADTALRRLNEDVQADHLDPILADLTAAWSLTPDEILPIPGLFEEPFGCGRRVAALIPGMANLTVVNVAGGPTKVFLADPFLRSDLADQGTDPLIAHVRATFPPSLELFFVDDWDTYHMALGEVHCGTNVLRTPDHAWWGAAAAGGAP